MVIDSLSLGTIEVESALNTFIVYSPLVPMSIAGTTKVPLA